jgi:AraC family transcriptional regulator
MEIETDIQPTHEDCLKALRQYIHQHLDRPLQREVLAEVAGFSVPHLHRVFRGHTGESIAAYVRRIRLERAGRKLRIGVVDITEVALAAGYLSHAAFSKAFKAQYGLSPDAFRRLDCFSATRLLRGEKWT